MAAAARHAESALRREFDIGPAPHGLGEAARDDAAYFERYGERRHRVRLAVPAEFQLFGTGLPVVPPDGFRYVAVVYRTASGVRMKRFGVGTLDPACDLPEEHAHSLWMAFAPPGSEACRVSQAFMEHFGGGVPEAPPTDRFCLRLAVGTAAPGYSSVAVAEAALDRFVARTELPLSIFDFGGEAVYAVVRLTAAGSAARWAAAASKLERLARHHGLRLDGPVTAFLPFNLAEILGSTGAAS